MNKSELILIIKEEIKGVLNESKQVGVLYHYTDLDNIENIKKNGLRFSKPQDEISDMYFISTTRRKQAWDGAEIALDGDKISERYKITPIQASTFLDHPGEEWEDYIHSKIDSLGGEELAEERILSKSSGFLPLKYIIEINVDRGDSYEDRVKK